MKHEQQVALIKRVLAHIEAKTTDTSGASHHQPVAAYADGARFERERTRLFGELPVAIGHISQLPAAGSFFTHDAAGAPLLIVRGDDGEVRALLNVCRHRGTRVEDAARGEKNAFQCPYHAWTYDRAGCLTGVPHERGFVGLDAPRSDGRSDDASGVVDADRLIRGKRNLVEVPCAVIAGLIFVAPKATTIDRSWLGSLEEDLVGFGLATSHHHRPQRTERALSWKLGIDVFLETYHLRTTHHNSIYPLFFDTLGLVDPVGPHLRNVFPKRSITTLAGRPESEWRVREHGNVLFHLFPNTLVLVEPDHAAVLHLWPDGPSRCVLTSYMLVPEPPATDKARAYWKANDTILMNAVGEDFAMGESIQRGLASGANTDVVFGAFEHALTHFHTQIDRLG